MHLFICLSFLFVCVYLYAFICLFVYHYLKQSLFNRSSTIHLLFSVCVCEWLATAVGGVVIATVMSHCRQTAVPLSSSLYGRNSRVWDRLYFERHFRKIFCIPLYSWLKLWVTMLNKWYIYIYIEYAQCTSRRVQNWSFWFFCLFYKSYPR